MKIKVGIIGLGHIGNRHFDILNELPSQYKIVAVCDSNLKNLRNLDKKIAIYQDYEMLLDADIDLVHICTPHHLHAEMTIKALSKGNHVLVEKPMCLSSEEAKAMIAASIKYKRKLFVVKQNRFNEPVAAVQQLIEKGKLGKIYDVQCNVWWNRNEKYYLQSDWRGKLKTERGALFTQASHFIDLLVWWFGPVEKAKTMLATKAHNIQIEDCGHSIVQFKSGTIGSINWNNNLFEKNYEGSVTIIAEKGTVKIGGAYLNEIEYWNVKGIKQPKIKSQVKPNLYKGNYQGSGSNHAFVFKAVAKALINKTNNNLVEGIEAKAGIDSIIKIYQSV
jgi:predicted dehydrogenase